MLFFPLLPGSASLSSRHGKTVMPQSQRAVKPSLGSALQPKAQRPQGAARSSLTFPAQTGNALVTFLLGPVGYLLSLRMGLLLFVALLEVSVSILLSPHSPQSTTSAVSFRDHPKLTCQFSCYKSEENDVSIYLSIPLCSR